MNRQQLFENIKKKESFLCVGLDTDITRIPRHLLSEDDPVFAFNKAIIDATKDLVIAYKPNIAFYESRGEEGWHSLKKTLDYIPEDIFTIADAKRGDIGNTTSLYARTYFEQFDFDALTVAPYMGHDSVLPYLEYRGKWVVLLALTSNEGALDFQFSRVEEGRKALFEKVLEKSCQWGTKENLMYVVGATRPEMLEKIRKIVPDNFLLVPGVGAQGGSLEKVAEYGFNGQCGLIVNSSRSVIYCSDGKDFAEKAAEKAFALQQQMSEILKVKLAK